MFRTQSGRWIGLWAGSCLLIAAIAAWKALTVPLPDQALASVPVDPNTISLEVSPDGKELLASSCKVSEVPTARKSTWIQTWRLPLTGVEGTPLSEGMKADVVRFSPCGTYLVLASQSGIVFIDRTTKKELRRFGPRGREFWRFEFSRDSRWCAAVDSAGAVFAWNLNDLGNDRRLTENAHQIAFGNTANELIVVKKSTICEIIDLAEGRFKASLPILNLRSEEVNAKDAAVSANGRLLAVLASNGSVGVWTLDDCKIATQFVAHREDQHDISAISFAAGDTVLITSMKGMELFDYEHGWRPPFVYPAYRSIAEIKAWEVGSWRLRQRWIQRTGNAPMQIRSIPGASTFLTLTFDIPDSTISYWQIK